MMLLPPVVMLRARSMALGCGDDVVNDDDHHGDGPDTFETPPGSLGDSGLTKGSL